MEKYLSRLRSVSARFISTSLLKIIVQTIISFLTLKLIKIDDLGIWQIVLLLQSFSYIFHLGAINGISREVPYLIGKKRVARIYRMLETTTAFLNMLYTVFFVLFLVVVLYFFLDKSLSWLKFMIVLTGYIQFVFAIESSYYASIFRGNSSFKKLVFINLVSVIFSIILFPIVYWKGFIGLLFYQNILAIATLFLYKYHSPYKVKKIFRKLVFIKTVKTGLPILITSIIGILNKNMVKIVLMYMATISVLGKYSIVAFIINGLTMIPNVLSQYLFPTINKMFGSSHNKIEVYRYIQVKKRKIFVFGSLFSIIAILIMPFIITNYLSKFTEAILSCQIAVLIGFINSLQIGGNIFHTVGKSKALSTNYLAKSVVFFLIAPLIILIYQPTNILNTVMIIFLCTEFIFYLGFELQLKTIVNQK